MSDIIKFEGGATYELIVTNDEWPGKTLWRVGGWYVALIFGQAVAYYLLHDYFTLKGKEHAKIVFDFLFGG